MSPSTRQQPLFARPSSEHSEEYAAAEDDALMGKRASITRIRPGSLREILLLAWAVAATVAIIVLAILLDRGRSNVESPESSRPGKRNLIFMVSDGMGPASLSLTRSFRQHEEGLAFGEVLHLDQHLIGTSRTRSNNSLVTDSAAGATAFSCGKKSYNGAISMLPDHTPCGTVMEAAKRAGYTTGLVVTTDITDATPACFAAHVNVREEEDSIASQEVGEHPLGIRVVDLMFGGGRCHFLPNTTESSCRNDDRDIVQLAQDTYDWNYVSTREQFDSLNHGTAVKLPMLGLFADTDIPYELDRRTMNDVYPSLDEMARTALKALEEATRDSEKGFFLMIEGSRIDHAGHANDPSSQVREVLAFDKAFSSVLEFLDNSSVDGVVVTTSDHETGGLSVAKQLHSTYPEYLWHPEVLANASHSGEYLVKLQRAFNSSGDATQEEYEHFIRTDLVENGLGIFDATDAEITLMISRPSSYRFNEMISRRAQIGWSTHGHSAVDVNIYGSRGSAALRGNHENTDVGVFLREYLAVDVDAVTEDLRAATSEAGLYSWAGPLPTPRDGDVTARYRYSEDL